MSDNGAAFDREVWRRKLWELIEAYKHGHNFPQSCRDSIKHHLTLLPPLPEESMLMTLCEAHRVVLQINRPYVFRPIGNCETCKKMADQAYEAYGPTGRFGP